MIKWFINLLLSFVFFFFGLKVNAQKVSNISFRQEQSNIVVSYDLETKSFCSVSLYVSTNGGASWQGPLKKVNGGVGDKINSGSNNITWNVLEEFEELRGDKILFQVKANESDMETVLIGHQEWTKRNLNVTTYRNGDEIPQVQNPNEWSKLRTGAWCYYDNDPNNGKVYGKLYNWYAVNDPRGLAPEGFHIPTTNELSILNVYLGGMAIAGGKMKEQYLAHWASPNENASNSSSFTGLPGGNRNKDGEFSNIGDFGFWWCDSMFKTKANSFSLSYNHEFLFEVLNDREFGFSVRCVKD